MKNMPACQQESSLAALPSVTQSSHTIQAWKTKRMIFCLRQRTKSQKSCSATPSTATKICQDKSLELSVPHPKFPF